MIKRGMATLYHCLKSKISHDKYEMKTHNIYYNKLDVSKIFDMTYGERLFCIFHKEYPYKLCMKYKIIYNENTESIGVTTGLNLSLTSTKTTKFYYEFEMRYQNEEILLSDFNEIKMKQQILNEYLKKEDNNIQKIYDEQIQQIQCTNEKFLK